MLMRKCQTCNATVDRTNHVCEGLTYRAVTGSSPLSIPPDLTPDEVEAWNNTPPTAQLMILEERKASKKAMKQSEGKPKLSMISYELLEGLAKVREFGEKKYARDNWKLGFPVTVSIDAALRHIFKFLKGETNDDESGLLHLYHAVADLEHAIYDMTHHPENDDRSVKK